MATEMDDNNPIYIISDLHLGDGGPRDNFAFDEKLDQFNLFLDMVEKEKGRLYILGDLFDFWQGNVGKILMNRKSLLDRFASLEAKYVVGNHDLDLEEFIDSDFLNHPFFERMSGPFIEEIGGRRFKFMHGHEVEPDRNERRPGWGKVLTIIRGIIEDRKGSPMFSAGGGVERVLIGLSKLFMGVWNFAVNHFEHAKYKNHDHLFKEELTPTQEPHRVPDILKLYELNRRLEGYDVVVAGHTHRPRKIDPWYYNSGCWVGIRNHFLVISPEGNVELYEWNGSEALMCD